MPCSAQIARWTRDNAGRIVAALPAVTFPDALHDRARDAWESLLAIANAAGGDWAGRDGRAWKACEHFAAASEGDEDGIRELLLGDLHAIFEQDAQTEAIPSATIVDRLVAMEGPAVGGLEGTQGVHTNQARATAQSVQA